MHIPFFHIKLHTVQDNILLSHYIGEGTPCLLLEKRYTLIILKVQSNKKALKIDFFVYYRRKVSIMAPMGKTKGIKA